MKKVYRVVVGKKIEGAVRGLDAKVRYLEADNINEALEKTNELLSLLGREWEVISIDLERDIMATLMDTFEELIKEKEEGEE